MTGSPIAAPHRGWLFNALTTVALWGVWGAFSGLSPQHGFPETLVYCVWSLTMIPPALIVLKLANWRLDRDPVAIGYGLIIGLLGAGGQMVLFYAVTKGPPYLIFPIISLSPVVTIAMSFALLGERTTRLGAAGIVLALLALPTFDFSFGGEGAGQGVGWFILALARSSLAAAISSRTFLSSSRHVFVGLSKSVTSTILPCLLSRSFLCWSFFAMYMSTVIL